MLEILLLFICLFLVMVKNRFLNFFVRVLGDFIDSLKQQKNSVANKWFIILLNNTDCNFNNQGNDDNKR